MAIADEVAAAIVNQALRLDRVPSADTYTKVGGCPYVIPGS